MRDDLLGKYEKTETSVRASKALEAQEERRERLHEVMSNVQDLIGNLERKHGMEPGLSRTVMGTDMKPASLADMWDQAVQKREFREIHDELREFSARATAKNRRGYENARRFIAAPPWPRRSMSFVGAAASRKTDATTSLTADLGVAVKFGRRRDGVILEYDGASIRKTGKAIPAQYSHRHSRYGESINRGLTLMFSLEDETRIPDATEGPVLKHVMLGADNAFAGRLRPDVGRLEDAGMKVSAFRLVGAVR